MTAFSKTNRSALLYLHQQAVDTTTPAGRALFGMMGVFAEFERAIIRERVNAGLARAREQGRVGGRPRVPAEVERRIRGRLVQGAGIRKVAALEGVGISVVQRVKAEGQHPLKQTSKGA